MVFPFERWSLDASNPHIFPAPMAAQYVGYVTAQAEAVDRP